MTDDELRAAQDARWNDPATQEAAQAKANQTGVAQRRNEARSLSQLAQLRKAPTMPRKIYWLRQLIGTLAESATPVAACREGCSACCHQPVMISEAEAKVIAQETGATMRRPASWRFEAEASYSGKPCPFLVDSRCSIYAARPIACRLLFNLDSDDLLCRIIPGSPVQVPYVDTRQYHALYVEAHGRTPRELLRINLADLREFFPDGKVTR